MKRTRGAAASVAIPLTFPVIFLFIFFVLIIFTLAFNFALHRLRRRENRLLAEAEDQTREFRRLQERLKVVSQDLESATRELDRLAIIDPLTGLANSRGFELQMEKEWQRQMRDGKSITLLLVRIDSFKSYIELYGPERAEGVQKKIAETILAYVFRPGDFAARLVGGEFLIILPATDVAGAKKVAERLQEKLAELSISHLGSPKKERLTVSMVLASVVPDPGMRPSTLLERASGKWEEAKAAGPGTIFCA